MAQGIGKEIAEFVERAETMGATPVLKLFMIPTPDLKRTRCEFCGRGMLVFLRGTSRPVCGNPECPSRRLYKEESPCYYHVFTRRGQVDR